MLLRSDIAIFTSNIHNNSSIPILAGSWGAGTYPSCFWVRTASHCPSCQLIAGPTHRTNTLTFTPTFNSGHLFISNPNVYQWGKSGDMERTQTVMGGTYKLKLTLGTFFCEATLITIVTLYYMTTLSDSWTKIAGGLRKYFRESYSRVNRKYNIPSTQVIQSHLGIFPEWTAEIY